MSDKKPIATITPIAPEGQNPSKCCVCTPLKFACFTFTYLTLVVNTFNTLMIVGVLITAGVTTGFKFTRPTAFDAEPPTIDTDEMAIDSEISSILLFVLYITGIILLLNTMWLCWNIYLLVGLHMKRPGSVRLNVSIATVRFVLMFVPLWIGPGDFLILTWSEIGVTGLFIIFYYKYATQLERKQKPRIHNIENPQEKEITVTDVYFAYPKYLDKQHLVEKEKY